MCLKIVDNELPTQNSYPIAPADNAEFVLEDSSFLARFSASTLFERSLALTTCVHLNSTLISEKARGAYQQLLF
jgi:hypothetical protein